MKTKRITAISLSVLMLVSTLFSSTLTAFAAPITIQIMDSDWDRAAATNLWNGGSIDASEFNIIHSSTDEMLYCIEPGQNLNSGDGLDVGTYLDNLTTPSITQAGQVSETLGRLFQYVNYNSTGNPLTSENGQALYIATQVLVWEVLQGERDINFNYVTPPSSYNQVMDCINNSSLSSARKSMVKGHYDSLVNQVQNHMKVPSFASTNASSAQTYPLTSSGGQLTTTLEDTNNVLANYSFTSNPNVAFSVNGNELTATAQNGTSGVIAAQAASKNKKRKGVICYGDQQGGLQDVVKTDTLVDDPINAYFNLEVLTGNLEIIKTTVNNDGNVAGFEFTVEDSSGNSIGNYTTDETGVIHIPNLNVGTYTVEEVNLSDDFVKPTPNPVTIEVLAGQTATVNFNNIKKMGIISVKKNNTNPSMGDYSLAGAEFTVTDSNGTVVDTIVTAEDGSGQSKPLPLGSYTIIETKAPYGMVVNHDTWTATLSGSLGDEAIVYAPEIAVPEKPQVGTITITKNDKETADIAQGDATLKGAVFEIYAADKITLVDTIYCNETSSATTKELPLGTYYYKEKVPPVGYTLDENFYPIEIAYAGQDIEVTHVDGTLSNTVIKGKICIIKHDELENPDVPGNSQVENPLAGAEFDVYLKSAGSYETAKGTEKDHIVTDENGFAMTKMLPYGTYIVAEVVTPEGHKSVPPFEVFISTDGKMYPYILNDPNITAPVKIIKVDSESKKPITLAGTEFKVKDLSTGEWVSQSFNYPTPTTIDTFVTATDGTLVMPENLKYGKYELHEVKAPYGYTINTTPVPFEIKDLGRIGEQEAELPTSQSGAMVTVNMENTPVKGKVTIEKTGEVLTGATITENEFGELYTPTYEVKGLKGAEFNIIADEDITTPDGIVHAKKGDIVDTITTGDDGKAISKELYLGKYSAVETKVPTGYILNPTPIPFELVYSDQNTALVSAQVRLLNERAKCNLSFYKVAEQAVVSEDGKITYEFVPVEGVVFGLYAKEDIKNSEDKVIIPANSLVDVMTTDKDGKASNNCDIPYGSFYVKELKTKDGLILNDQPYEFIFEYKDANTPQIDIILNDGKNIENQLLKGKIKVIKTDGESKEPLEGVVFEVKDKDGNIVSTLTTDKDGIALTEPLPYGDYTVKEKTAKDGYIIDETVYEIKISENEKVYELAIQNKKVPEKPKTPTPVPSKPTLTPNPKTGDSSNATIWLCIGGVAVGALISVIILRKRGDKK